MADVEQAIQFVLLQEDSRLTGVISTLPGDAGGATRFGVASRFHPDLVAIGFYAETDGVPVISQAEALAIAEQVYANEYAVPLMLTEIVSQDVANRLLSFAINEGVGQAVKIAQRAVDSLGGSLVQDGKFGPLTLAGINGCDPLAYIAAERCLQVEFYEQMVIAHPNLLPYKAAFLARAEM